MADLFADDRIQFYLRNREDIRTWAAIESDVMAATRELLARSQAQVEKRIVATDPEALVGRHDSGQWERIFVRYERWPSTVGVALEWSRSVDPLGGNRPKLGVFWWADPPTLVAPRTRLVGLVDKAPLLALGYKVPLEGVWPVGMRVAAAADWWTDPDAWVTSILDSLVSMWALVAPKVDAALLEKSGVSGGA